MDLHTRLNKWKEKTITIELEDQRITGVLKNVGLDYLELYTENIVPFTAIQTIKPY